MSTYIHFTEEQKERAAAVDLEAFLRHRGEKLITSGRDKRLASDHSITIRGNEWFDHATCKGGHAISFVQTYMRVSYPEAVTLLLGGEIGTEYPRASERKEEPPKPFELPEANKDVRRVFAYLMKNRQIERDVVSHFVKEKVLYEDAQYHNAVFVGTDEDGIPRHAHKRSTNSYGKAFRINIEGSDPRHSFHHAVLYLTQPKRLGEAQLCGMLRHIHSTRAEDAGATAAGTYRPALPRQRRGRSCRHKANDR